MKDKIKAALLTATLPVWIAPFIFCHIIYTLYKVFLDGVKERE